MLLVVFVVTHVWFKIWNKKRKKAKKHYNQRMESLINIFDVVSFIVWVFSSIVLVIRTGILLTQYTPSKVSERSKILNCSRSESISVWVYTTAVDGWTASKDYLLQFWTGWDPYYMYLENEDSFWFTSISEVKTNWNYQAESFEALQKQVIADFQNLGDGYTIWGQFCPGEVKGTVLPPIAEASPWNTLYFVITHSYLKPKTKEEKQTEEKEYKKSCQTLSFNKFEKDSYPYIGTKVYFRWHIDQATTSDDWGDFFRLGTRQIWWNTRDDIIWILSPKTEFVKDDVIQVRWEVVENYCYKTVMWSQICLPTVKARYIQK